MNKEKKQMIKCTDCFLTDKFDNKFEYLRTDLLVYSTQVKCYISKFSFKYTSNLIFIGYAKSTVICAFCHRLVHL